MPFLVIICSQIIAQFEGVFIKKYNEKHDKGGMIFTAIISLFSMIFFLLMDVITDEKGLRFTAPILLYGLFAGIAFCLASFLTFIALGCGSFVLSRLILSYGVLITVAHGLFLNEPITLWGWLGIALIIASLYFVKGDNKEENVKISKKWIITIGLSVLFAGVFGILQREQQRQFNHQYDNEFMMITLGVSALSLMIAGIIKDGKDLKYILKNGGLYAMGAGFSNGGTNLLQLFAFTLLPMSLVAPMTSGASILISFVISKVIFKEKFSKLQYVGVMLGGIALVLFNL